MRHATLNLTTLLTLAIPPALHAAESKPKPQPNLEKLAVQQAAALALLATKPAQLAAVLFPKTIPTPKDTKFQQPPAASDCQAEPPTTPTQATKVYAPKPTPAPKSKLHLRQRLLAGAGPSFAIAKKSSLAAASIGPGALQADKSATMEKKATLGEP